MGADITILTAGALTDRSRRALPLLAGAAELRKLGSVVRGPASAPLARVWELFGMPPPDTADYPVAALEYLGRFGRPVAGWCICADLVHLRPESGGLSLVAGDSLGLGQAHGDALFGELEEHFSDRGWRWFGIRVTHAVLQIPDAPQIRTHPPDTIAGADVDPHLPFGPDAKEWHRFMNECQMRLHGCAINDARERSGTPTANSVWFWGGGRLPTAPQSRPWELVFTEDSLFQGLAAVAGTPSAPLPGNMDALLERVSAGQRALLVCCSLRSLLWMPDTEQGGRALERLDETWVAPAIRALREGRLRVLTVSDPEYGDIVLTARGVRRWWRAWGWKPSRRIKTTKA